jgi:uncharacterized protein YeaC (DUF1315 family)
LKNPKLSGEIKDKCLAIVMQAEEKQNHTECKSKQTNLNMIAQR